MDLHIHTYYIYDRINSLVFNPLKPFPVPITQIINKNRKTHTYTTHWCTHFANKSSFPFNSYLSVSISNLSSQTSNLEKRVRTKTITIQPHPMPELHPSTKKHNLTLAFSFSIWLPNINQWMCYTTYRNVHIYGWDTRAQLPIYRYYDTFIFRCV